jgi:O-antigen/teichoic acid export membrane protein
MKGKKDFIASGAVYTILGFLPTASRLFLFPLFLHYLTPDDFALISLNTMVAGILPTFMTLGLEQSMNKFYFDFVKFPKIEKVFLSTLIISIITISAVLSAIFILVGPELFAISFKSHRFTFFPYGFTALLTAIPGSMNMLFYNYLRCRKDLRHYVILNLGVFLLTSIGEIVAIVFLKMHVDHLVWVKPLLMWPFMLASTAVLLWKTGIHFEKRLLRMALQYSSPLLPHLIFSLVFVYTDRIMIENNLNLTYLAIYNLTMAVSGIIDIFEQALRNATFPNIFKLLKENVYTNVDAISRIHTINGLILMAIVSGVALMVPIGDYYFLKPIYRPLIYLIPFALIISVTRFFYIVYAEPLFFFKKVKHVSTSTFLQGCFSILFNFLLIPRFGLMGAIMANILSKCIQVAYIYYTSLSIKIFRYKVGFILTSMFTIITILIGLTFSSRYMIDSRIIIHLLATTPFIFTSFVFFYFIKKNKISLRQLW